MSKKYTYACDTVEYKRNNKPDAWITTDKINGQMFSSYPVFSFIPGTKGDEQPVRFGDFVIDIDTKGLACAAALLIIDWFKVVFAVDEDQWRVYLSGKKGIHLELPAEILGTESGHVWLPLAYKRLALDIEASVNTELDISMYNRGTGKPFRRPNVMRDTGTCKRQINFEDIEEIFDVEDYVEACSEPGPTWEPENIAKNDLLADKVKSYIDEAIKQQKAIVDAPELTDDERDRLINNIPNCMKVLSHLTTWTNGKTFNDIALQVTAYAVTTGMSESSFLAGCGIFIANYPSSSLDTHEKRLENCRARYRTMKANGNQHSCGGVLSLGVPGFDCNTCHCKPAAPLVSVAVMTKDDINTANNSLIIPPDVLDPGGLISLGMRAVTRPGMIDIDQYNLPAVLATIAHAASGKITCMGKWPNLFILRVGPTSTGKSTADAAIKEALEPLNIPNFYGDTDFASGPALMRSVSNQPIQMCVVDEVTSLFKRYKGGDGLSDGKRDALLELFSKSGGRISKSYAESKKNIVIVSPCVTITGNATPVIFDTISQEDFETGTMQRFDFWNYDGLIPKRGIIDVGENKEMEHFIQGIVDIRGAMHGDNRNLSGIGSGGENIKPFALEMTPDCRSALSAWSDEVVDRANDSSGNGEQGIVSRGFDLSIKYALVHIAGTRPPEKIFMPMGIEDLEYGKKVAKMLCEWKINTLINRVSTGEFDTMCKHFVKAIEAVVKSGRRPTFVLMKDRRPALRNWKERESAEVISILSKRGDIVIDESKKKTAYFLPKK